MSGQLRALRVLALMAAILMVLTFRSHSDALYGRRQAEPVLLYRYFGDQIATTFVALTALRIELMKQPDVQGYIIIYNGLKDPIGLPYRHSLGVKNYLVKNKNVSPDRVEVHIAKDCEIFSVDVWLVAKGARKPKPSCTFETEVQGANDRGKFDEYLFDYEHPDGSLYDDPYLKLQGFAKAVLKDPNAVGYIIGYGHRRERSEGEFVGDKYSERKNGVWDKIGTGKRIADVEKRVLVKNATIDPSRMITIDGGYRESRMIELWVAPSGALKPKPTPTLTRTK